MPTIEENRRKWDGTYHWTGGGDNWSESWGSAEMQWHASILPRIHQFLPVGTILEIAPGFGRWTEFLIPQCDRLIAVDLSTKCIDACRERFGEGPDRRFYANDGTSLAMVEDGTIDFVFSFDSLVHAEADVVESYLRQLARKMTPDGVAFLHHSNAGDYDSYYKWVRGIAPIKLVFRGIGLETREHGRARSMSAAKFRTFTEQAGLKLIRQELINWRSNLLLDALSIVCREGSAWGTSELVTVRNRRFMSEARNIARMSPLYSGFAAKP